MADQNRQVDAVWIDPSVLRGEPSSHAARIAGDLFGMKPGAIRVNITSGVDGGLFIRREATDPTYFWPTIHTNANTHRYEWEDDKNRGGSKVRLGYKHPEPAEND